MFFYCSDITFFKDQLIFFSTKYILDLPLHPHRLLIQIVIPTLVFLLWSCQSCSTALLANLLYIVTAITLPDNSLLVEKRIVQCSQCIMHCTQSVATLSFLSPSGPPCSDCSLYWQGKSDQKVPSLGQPCIFFPVAILKYSFSKLEVINPKYKLRCFFCFIIFKNGIPSYLVRSIYKKFWISFLVSE